MRVKYLYRGIQSARIANFLTDESDSEERTYIKVPYFEILDLTAETPVVVNAQDCMK